MFTIEQISERTGMSIHVLRKYINRLKPYLEPYIARGENNRIFFTAPGLIVFDNIKQFKEQGMALPSIKKELDKLSGPDVQSGSQSVESVPKEEKPSVSKGIAKVEKGGSPNPPNDQTEHEYLKKLLETHEQLTLEKEKRNQDMSKHVETISNLQNELNNAKDQLRLLPEGKSPETGPEGAGG